MPPCMVSWSDPRPDHEDPMTGERLPLAELLAKAGEGGQEGNINFA